MANFTPAVINYKMYVGDEDYLGIAQITLPTLNFMTQEVKGAGIAGAVVIALIGQMNSMQVQVQMMTLSEQGIKLAKHEVQTWEFREVQQTVDGTTGAHKAVSVKHVMRVFPTSMDGGTLQPQSTSNPNITAQVYSWVEYRDGVKVLELDPFNYICYIDGNDYSKQVREALGMAEGSGGGSDGDGGDAS